MIDHNSLSSERQQARGEPDFITRGASSSNSTMGVSHLDRRSYDGNALSRSRAWTLNPQNCTAAWRTSNEQLRTSS